MQATLIFNDGNGGWPMTVFLLPDGRPIHAGTYYPKEDRYGRTVVPACHGGSHQRLQNPPRGGGGHWAAGGGGGCGQTVLPCWMTATIRARLTKDLLESAFHNALANFDAVNGGLQRAARNSPAR